MVNSPLFYAAILRLWLVALPGFLNISHVPGNVNVMSVVITATPSLLIFAFFGSHYNSSVGSMKYRLQNINSQYQYAYRKVLTRVSGIRGYCPHLLKYQDF